MSLMLFNHCFHRRCLSQLFAVKINFPPFFSSIFYCHLLRCAETTFLVSLLFHRWMMKTKANRSVTNNKQDFASFSGTPCKIKL